MKKLTEKQKEIFNYIKSSIDEKDIAPSVREIATAVGLNSTSSVQYNLNALEQAGLIVRGDHNQKRTLRLAGVTANITRVPLLGTVTAGVPILAEQYIEEYLPIAGIHTSNECFALHVKGDSMINAHILDGDIIVVERTAIADNGTIVVAMIDSEATVKRFYKEKGHVRLQPENDAFEPIIADNVDVLGKVTKVIRSIN